MKLFKSLPFAFILMFGCKSRPGTLSIVAETDTSIPISSRHVDSSFFAKSDSVLVGFPGFDTATYSRTEFNDIVAHFPELYRAPIFNPDIAYNGCNFSSKPAGGAGFNSEAGQDEFYVLYAFFLRKRDTGRMLAGSRDTLLLIFEEINRIFDDLNHGGTYYGHQSYRILGYAEYSIYLLSQEAEDFKKRYSISAQKAAFINQLRQQIADEIGVDNELIGKDQKADARREMLKSVRKINDWIASYFYLREARKFMYEYYDVY